MKTISGRTIEVKANEKDLTFDITVDEDTTYRTAELSQEEFDENEFNTANDWQHYLNHGDYYKI